jgi:energy-coupling factor transporter ATP-binding protein EcfA2
MTDFPRHLEVDALFGALSPSVKLRLDERITILTGPNGSGKTHILKLLRHLLAGDLVALARLPFGGLRLEYSSGKLLDVARAVEDSDVSMHFRGHVPREESPYSGIFQVSLDPLHGIDIPPYISRLDEDVWIDTRDDELMTTSEVLSRFGRLAGRRRGLESLEAPAEWPPEWIVTHFVSVPPTFIATARLDASLSERDMRRVPGPRYRPTGAIRQTGTVGRIRQYVDRIRDQIAEARRSSLAVSQRADQEFASRALDKARETIKERELQERYEKLASLQQALHANGLTSESLGVSFPSGRTNPTERRILFVFLRDWEEKLRPLLPVHRKLQLLREIVGQKLLGKDLLIENDEPTFVTESGQTLSVEMLSSGEQHLLALYTMLLFAADPGSVVLIDEPEISLHAAWKHAFLDDIARVAGLNDLQVMLATHSTAIINGRWELVEELDLTV